MKITKRIVAVVLAVLFVAAAFVGCSSASKTDDKKTTDETTVKFGLITLHDNNSTYDKNFITAAEAACEEMGVELVQKNNIEEGQACYDAAADLVDAGCTVVMADSFGHEDFMIQAAKEFTDVQFLHATGVKAASEGLANYHNAFASIYEGRYLAGVAAGTKLNAMIEAGDIKAEEAKMGYVGAYTYAEVVSGYTSFYLGAKSVCPTVTMEVTFTGSWYDETAEKEAAQKLISNKCVLISQHADSMGAPTACETAGVPNVSYNGSTESACPNTFIVSSRIDWAPFIKYAIESVKNGTAMDANWTGTTETGSVVLTDLGQKGPAAGTAEAIETAKAGLADGSVKVFDTSAFTVEVTEDKNANAVVDKDGHLTSYKVNDTEVVKDGQFCESDIQSAPYFDLQIDGITLLDVNFG